MHAPANHYLHASRKSGLFYNFFVLRNIFICKTEIMFKVINMKKTLAILVAFVLLSSVTFAAQGDRGGDGMVPDETGQGGPEAGQETGRGETVQAEERAREGEGAQNRERLQSGLENALTRVTNENARMRLQQNLEKFMARYQERLERKMQNVTIDEVDEETGAVTIKAKEPVRWFGLIKGTATKRFEMDDKGNVNERAPWYAFLYSEAEE
jgi:hypothetical protein